MIKWGNKITKCSIEIRGEKQDKNYYCENLNDLKICVLNAMTKLDYEQDAICSLVASCGREANIPFRTWCSSERSRVELFASNFIHDSINKFSVECKEVIFKQPCGDVRVIKEYTT